MTIKTPLFAGASRAMFNHTMSASPMMRGPMVSYDAEDDQGSKTAEEIAAEEAARLAAEGADEDDNDGDQGGSDDDADDDQEGRTPTDAEAKLLKEQMKTKKALKAAKDAEKAAKDALAAYKGADPAKVTELLAREAEAERKSLEAKGEYDRILAQVNEQHAAALTAKDTELTSTRDELSNALAQIDELTIGNAFGNSKFLAEKTVLSAPKARKLFGDHFEQVDGKTVGYDKPKGAKDRTPLVDAQGNTLSFEAAIEKIVRADEDFERIAKSNLKTGSNSQGSQHKADESTAGEVKSGVSRIAANLGKLSKVDPKAK